jgi:hypothetical protein
MVAKLVTVADGTNIDRLMRMLHNKLHKHVTKINGKTVKNVAKKVHTKSIGRKKKQLYVHCKALLKKNNIITLI